MNSVKTASMLLALATSLFAQAPVGEITGQVADSTGAVVTGAKVTVTNPATNPTGAVAVVRHGGKTYCFDSACPSCKIPLTKAKVTEQPSSSSDSQKPKVVLSCDFCTASYDLASGARVEKPSKESSGGLFSGIVSNIMSADPRSAGPLRLYKLSQQGGKLKIAID